MSDTSSPPGAPEVHLPEPGTESGHPVPRRHQAAGSKDVVVLGEVALRLDPGEDRIATAETFHVGEHGHEYHVARGLRRCFGLAAGIVTSVVDDQVGRLLEGLMLRGGLDLTAVRWVAPAGSGEGRNGIVFEERGFGARRPVILSDRLGAAAGRLQRGDVDWDEVFSRSPGAWFYSSSGFGSLSASSPEVLIDAIAAARRHGSTVCYGIRPRRRPDGPAEVRAVALNSDACRQADILIGTADDLRWGLGLKEPGADRSERGRRHGHERLLREIARSYPNLERVVVCPLPHDLRGAAAGYVCGEIVDSEGPPRADVLDPSGGDDGFVAGVIYGLFEKQDMAVALEYGRAHRSLCMTTPGAASMTTLGEVEQLTVGPWVNVRR